MKLKDWADKEGISYITAYRWFKSGKLPVHAYQAESGTIIVEDDAPETSEAIVTDNQRLSDSPVSQLIKKAVEISKAGAPVEDLATFVISNFKLEKHEVVEVAPRRARMKPTKEMTESHFKKFMKTPKSKPEAQMFLVNENDLDNVVAASEKVSSIGDGMGVEFTGAQNFGKLVPTTSAEIANIISNDQSITSVMSTAMHQSQNLVATPKPLTSLDLGSGAFYRAIDGRGTLTTNSTLSAANVSVPSATNFTALASLVGSSVNNDDSNDVYLDDSPEPMNEAVVYDPVTYDEARALVTLTSPDLLDPLTADRRAKQFCLLDRGSFDNLYKSVLSGRK